MNLRLMVILLLTGCFSYSQGPIKERIRNLENFDKKRWSWGYYLGMNSYDYKFDYEEVQEVDIQTETSLGFNVGLVGDLRINDYINLRLEPGISFVTRNLTFPDPTLIEESDRLREVTSTYINVPLLVKFSTKRLNNVKPFVVGGVSWSRNLSSNEDSPDDNLAGQFRQKSDVFNYELGIGIDLYLFFFKFTPSIRGVFAMTDELVRDADPDSPYTGNISSMQSRGVFLNFTFQ
ncbi:PorT protein [Nonlabens spongiae]|uniref:PorT protein n=1 Tax=Nonlabens spongiae TaxID=331648 RepID=A0A1W6MJS4_9FLAO|nr:porin family protein [Nonlabens spongiae]ARN77864.1 PorT protein [Nonlabens spongiae]